MEEKQNTIKPVRRKLNIHFIHWGRNPGRDWRIIFSVATILVFCSIVISIFIFIKINKGDIFLVEKTNEEQGETLNLDKLKETASYYKAKALEFERIQNSKSRYVDPSL